MSQDFHSSALQFSDIFIKCMDVSIGEANSAHPFDVISKQTLWELVFFRLYS